MKRVKILVLITHLHIIGLILFMLSLSGCGKQEVEEISKEVIVPVKAIKLKRSNIKKILFFSGDVKGKDEVNVYSKVQGKLAEYKVEVGAKVKKGEVIALIDRDETGFKFEPAPVNSPLKGVIGKIYLDKGANILSHIPLALIINMDTVKVKINIPERYIPLVAKGQKAEVKVEAYPDQLFKGKISKMSPLINLHSRTMPVEITIPNQEHQLHSGMFARVSIIVKEHQNVLVLPRRAVLEKGKKKVVFVIEKSLAREREVHTGVTEKEKVEITEGLKEGEEIIIEGHYGLKDRMSVEKKDVSS